MTYALSNDIYDFRPNNWSNFEWKLGLISPSFRCLHFLYLIPLFWKALSVTKEQRRYSKRSRNGYKVAGLLDKPIAFFRQIGKCRAQIRSTKTKS
jgi:hypothetical protein